MSVLGRFLVEQGTVTEEQLADGLRYQREQNRRIGEVAMDRGVLSPGAVESIRDAQQREPRLFGDIAVRQRRLTRRALDELLFLQKVQHTYLGEALLLRGHLDREGYERLLGRHWDLPGEGRVSLRYLQDFFSDSRVVECLAGAVARVLRQELDEEATLAGVGLPFDPAGYGPTRILEGALADGRRLAACIGLSPGLADRLGGTAGSGNFFTAVLRIFGDMLRDASMLLRAGRVAAASLRPEAGDTLFLRCRAASGEVGLAVWIEDGAA